MQTGRFFKIAILAALFLQPAICVRARADEPTTQPTTSDADFDAMLAKLRRARGPDVVQMLAAFKGRFQTVDVETEPGRNRWNIRTLNKRGTGFDALRFTVPQGGNTHMYWAFSCPGVAQWYIVPTEGDLHGFEQFFRAGVQQYRLPPRMNRNLNFQELPTRLEPGKEYMLWFTIRGDQPVTMSLSIVLLNDQRKGDLKDVEWAIGVERDE